MRIYKFTGEYQTSNFKRSFQITFGKFFLFVKCRKSYISMIYKIIYKNSDKSMSLSLFF